MSFPYTTLFRSWHAVLYDTGEFDTHKFQRRDVDIGLRRDLSGSALPMIPQIRFTRGPISGLPGSQLLRPVRLLAPLHGSDRSPSHRGLAESARGVSPRAAHRFRT